MDDIRNAKNNDINILVFILRLFNFKFNIYYVDTTVM